MATETELALMAYKTYALSEENYIDLNGWTQVNPSHPQTDGFAGAWYADGNEVVIAFRGTDTENKSDFLADFLAGNIPAAGGEYSSQVWQAIELVADAMAANPGKPITLTGHSLGGGLASVMAVFFNLPAVVFDPAPFANAARDVFVGIPLSSTSPLELYFSLYVAQQNQSGRPTDPNFLYYYNTFSASDQSSKDAIYAARAGNVSGSYLQGEVLTQTLGFLPWVETPGALRSINIGSPAPDTVGMGDLHSMALMLAVRASGDFLQAVQRYPSLIGQLIDKNVYAHDFWESQTNLLNKLLKDQGSDGDLGSTKVLDRFAQDVLKLGEYGSTRISRVASNVDMEKALITTIMEYYNFGMLSDTTPFIESVDSGIRFDVNRISANSDHQGKNLLLDNVKNLVITGAGDIARTWAEAAKVWTIQSGLQSLTTLGLDDNEVQIGADGLNNHLSGAGGNDLLITGSGNDELNGGAGQDVLLGGIGNDFLFGGADFDTYVFKTGDGTDTIKGDDNDGKIVLNGIELTGANSKSTPDKSGRPTWSWTQSGQTFHATLMDGDTANGGTLWVGSGNGPAFGTDRIIIENFKTGDLSLALSSTQRTALLPDTHLNPFLNPDYVVSTLSTELKEGLSRTITLALDQSAIAGQIVRFTVSALSSFVKLVKGDDTLSFNPDGTVDVMLTAGQSALPFELLSQGNVDTDTSLTLTVTLLDAQGQPVGTASSLNIAFDASVSVSSVNADEHYWYTEVEVPLGNGISAHPYSVVGSGPLGILASARQETYNFTTVASERELSDPAAYYSEYVDRSTINPTIPHPTVFIPTSDYVGTAAGLGDSYIEGSAYRDVMTDGINDNFYYTGSFYDGTSWQTGTIQGYQYGNDNDVLIGGLGDDLLFTHGGNDRSEGGEGNDVIIDRPVADERSYSYSSHSWFDTAGNSNKDHLSGGAGNDIIVAGGGNALMDGGAGADELYAGMDDDTLLGGDGDDVLWGDGQQARMDVWTGIDNADAWTNYNGWLGEWVQPVLADPNVKAYDWNVTVNWNDAGTVTYHFVGIVEATTYTGKDFLDGGNGDDELRGGGNSDVLYGGAGNDSLVGDDAAHEETAGDDYLNGEDGNDTMRGEAGADTLIGGAGDDQLSGDGLTTTAVNQGNDFLDGGLGNDTLWGDGGSDTLLGGDGNDHLEGDYSTTPATVQGNDYLDGGAGDDNLLGDGGSDTLVGGAGIDHLYGEAGTDTLLGDDGDDYLQGDSSSTAASDQAADYLDGGAGNDVLIGDGGADTLLGGAGDDQLDGDSSVTPLGVQGDDYVDGGEGNDVLFGSGGNDTLIGGSGNDSFSGGDGDDTLDGGDGNDNIYGGAGNDTIYAGAGTDYLSGDAGNDAYIFSSTDLQPVNGVIDAVVDAQGNDTIIFTDGLASSEVDYVVTSGSSVQIGTAAGDRRLSIANSNIDLQFSDGQTLTLAQLVGQRRQGTVNVTSTSASAVLLGGYDNDSISALGADSTLSGGLGNDQLIGSELENTTFLYSLGDDNDSLGDHSTQAADGSGPVNTLVLSGVNLANLKIQDRDGQRFLVVDSGGSLQVGAATADVVGDRVLDRIQFDDGSIKTWAELVTALGVEVLGTSTGSPSTVTGTNVNDRIIGGTDDEVINAGIGDDQLDGGAGNDMLGGGVGSDTYLFNVGSGRDTINNGDVASGKVDRLVVSAAITQSHVVFLRDNNDLIIQVLDASDSVVVSNYFSGAGLDRIEFADGTVVTPANIVVSPISTSPSPWGDSITGTGGNDTIDALGGADVVNALDGNDTVLGGSGNDILDGGSGDDWLDGGTGADHLTGGIGNDTFVIDSTADVVTENVDEGVDTVISSVAYALSNSLENLVLSGQVALNVTGNALNNVITGNAANNIIETLQGDDVLVGGAGNDTLWGGEGNDTYVYNVGDGYDVLSDYSQGSTDILQFGEGITIGDIRFSLYRSDGTLNFPFSGNLEFSSMAGGVNTNWSVDTVKFSDDSLWTLRYIMNIGVNTLSMSDVSAVAVWGNDYANTIAGTQNSNYIDGRAGIDTLIGGAGDDVYVVNTALVSNGSSVVYWNSHPELRNFDDTVTELAGGGYDTMVAAETYSASLPDNVERLIVKRYFNTLYSLFYPVQWSASEDVRRRFTGNALDNIIDARETDGAGFADGQFNANGLDMGEIVIDGGAGADTMYGANYLKSRFIVDNVNDIVIASATSISDSVDSSVSYVLSTGVENITLKGSSAITATGNSLDNRLDGSSNVAANVLSGGAGNDTYVVGAGDVVIENIGEGNDTIVSTVDYDLSAGPANIENLTLTGGAYRGAGNSLNNVLAGSNGGNFINGGGGDDLLSGGAGNDIYYGFGVGSGNDTIIDSNGASQVLFSESNNVRVEDLQFIRIGDDLGVGISTTDTITMKDWFTTQGNRVNRLTIFEDNRYFDYTDTQIQSRIDGVNSGPTVNGAARLGEVGAEATVQFGYQFSANTFLDIESQHSLSYSASMIDDSALPAWLHFDAATRTLSGTPAAGDVGVLAVKVVATDVSGSTTSDVLTLNIIPPIIWGTDGNDSLLGTAGDDVMDGLSGNDTLNGQSGSDQLLGEGGDDSLFGGDGDDLLLGGDNNDLLDGGAGADLMSGEDGNDTYIVDNVGDLVEEYDAYVGVDEVQASVAYTLGAYVENLTLTGAAAISGTGNELDNVLAGNSGNNTLTGLVGNDTLDGGSAGTDTLVGGQGNDTYVVTRSSGITITESSNQGIDTVSASVTYTLGSNLENLVLTGASAINGTGNSLANVITGNGANNTLSGGAGADTLIGMTGNDTYVVDNTGDVVTENAGEGVDLVQSSAAYALSANVENLTLTGTSALNGTGNTLDNVLTGNGANNTLIGSDGNDTLNGGSGSDTMLGGLGNDTYVVAQTGDVVTESAGEGTDLVQSSITYTLSGNVENLTLTATTAINGTGNALDNILTGGSGANILTGGVGNDTLDGGTGTDTMVGGAGNDVYFANVSADVTTEAANEGIDSVNSAATRTLAANIEVLFLTGTTAINGTGNTLANLLRGNTGVNTLAGGGGTDILEGGAGNDILSNTSGNTLLNGGAGTDTLTGTANNDLLIGGTGNDALTTGAGADIIAFNKGDGQDTVAVSTAKDNTLSIGGGTNYADLLFQKSGSNLILKVGASDQITFTNYYASASNRSVNKLQVVLEGSMDYAPGGGDALRDNKVETFDFGGLVAAFDAALVANPSLTSWALSNALLTQYLSGSDTAAMGGDLAYQYGRYGNEANVSYTPAVGILGSASFGAAAQTLQALTSLQDSSPRLS